MKLTVQHGTQQYLLEDRPELRALIGQPVAIHTYADGRVELRVDGKKYQYTTLKSPHAGPIDVDSKSIHHTVDELGTIGKKRRNNNYRKNRPAAVNVKGVRAAKAVSAQKQARSR